MIKNLEYNLGENCKRKLFNTKLKSITRKTDLQY